MCMLFSGALFGQMEMDMDCTGEDLTPMEREHCKVISLVPTCCATQTAVANGNWFSASTWNTGTVPATGDKVYIPESISVTYNGSSEEVINWLRINGALHFSADMNTKLVIGTIVVDSDGSLTMGTSAEPVSPGLKCEIVFADEGPIDTDWDPFKFSKGMVMTGHFESYGAFKSPYMEVNAGTHAGSNKLTLAGIPEGWEVGDKLVIAGINMGHFNALDGDNKHHDEVLTITSISGNDIYFQNMQDGSSVLLFEHTPPEGYGLKMHVSNLTRNIVFRTENWETVPFSERGHCMFMHTLDVNINNTLFLGLGRTNKGMLATDPVVNEMGELVSGGENPRGRYACHIHHGGPSDNTVTPASIYDCVVDGTPGWGFVNHQSFVNIDHNVVYNFKGSAFVTEDGNEIGSMTNNIAVKGLFDNSGISTTDRVLDFDLGYDGTGYWLQSPNVDYANNIAASCAGSGFSIFTEHEFLAENKRYLLPTNTLADETIAGDNEYMYQAVIPLRSNTGSIVYNTSTAFTIWAHLTNDDDVGSFASNRYSAYTHDKHTVIEDFKFWNIYTTGFHLSYSSQVHFKDGLLLGDLVNRFDTIESAAPNSGYAFYSGAGAGGSNYIYDNLQVEGWNKAVMAFRTDEKLMWDDKESNYRTSKLIGGSYSNNNFTIVPEDGINEDNETESFTFPRYFQISDNPYFESALPDMTPVADFTYAQAGNQTLHLDASMLSYDPDPVVNNAGNGIAGFVWTLPDGSVQYGADIYYRFADIGTYSVTLTVYDCKGQTSAVSKNVYVEEAQYDNPIVNSGFEGPEFKASQSANSSPSSIATGWINSGYWKLEDGKVFLGLSVGKVKPLLQVIQDDYVRKGIVEFSFQAKNEGRTANDNVLIAEIYGVNGEFEYLDPAVDGQITKWNNNDTDFSVDLLFQEDFGTGAYGWQTFKRDVDFGDGYQFIIVRFTSSNLKSGQSDTSALDNICLPCVCDIPEGGFADALTSTSATLVWDNVGANSYIVKYKARTGAWIIDTVNNTYLELEDLTPDTRYQWMVKAQCDGEYTEYSATNKFTTPLEGSECTSPNILTTVYVTDNAAMLNWNAIPGALNYKVYYKRETDTMWSYTFTTQHAVVVAGLQSGTNYLWGVRSECAEGWKPNSSVSAFTTLMTREGSSVENTSGELMATVFPNPADNTVQVMLYCATEQDVKLSIYDLSGKLITSKTVSGDTGNFIVQYDISEIAAGTYIIKAGNSETTVTDKLIIY